MLKRVSSLVLSAALLLACVFTGAPSVTAVPDSAAQSTSAELSYADYIERHADYGATGETLTVDATLNFVSDRELDIAEIEGKRFVVTEDEGYIEWKFTVNKTGLYRISAVWTSAGGKGLDIIRTVSVDGNIPFDGLNSVYFRRSWENTGEVYFDSIIIVQLWMSMGAGFLAMRAGFSSVDASLYEPAAVDGIKNRFQELFYITVPAMGPHLMTAAVLQITSMFANSAVSESLVGSPSTNYAGHLIIQHLNDYSSVRFQRGYAAAISVILFVMMIFMNKLVLRLLDKVGR